MTRKIHIRTGLEPPRKWRSEFSEQDFRRTMQAEQCFAVAHKMDRKSIWPVCVGAWHTPVYPLVEHSGSEFPARSTVTFTAATLILPALTYAGHDNGKGNDGENNGRGNHKGERQIPVIATPLP